jgi:hypothetical protein
MESDGHQRKKSSRRHLAEMKSGRRPLADGEEVTCRGKTEE